MHIVVLVHILLSWAVVRCLAVPHLLMLLKQGCSLDKDFETLDVSSEISSTVNQLTLYTAGVPSAASAFSRSSDTVTVTLPDSTFDGSSSTSIPSIEEIESEVTPPFRRDVSFVASHAAEPAMQHDYVVKDLKERLLLARSQDVSETGLDPKCGGWYECIKKRVLRPVQSDSITPKCGGWYECIKTRVLQPVQSDLVTPKCGGWYECIRKRALEVIQLAPRCGGGYECIGRRLIDDLPTIKGRKLST